MLHIKISEALTKLMHIYILVTLVFFFSKPILSGTPWISSLCKFERIINKNHVSQENQNKAIIYLYKVAINTGMYWDTGIILGFNLFTPMFHYCTPRKRQKTKGFLTFSGDIEMGHWHEKC